MSSSFLASLLSDDVHDQEQSEVGNGDGVDETDGAVHVVEGLLG